MPLRRVSFLHRLFSLLLAPGALVLWMLRPTFETPDKNRRVAQTQTCLSNLAQISQAFALYARDYDGKFPRGVDPEDRFNAALWRDGEQGQYRTDSQTTPFLHEILAPYLPSREVWHCPADLGFSTSQLPGFQSSLRDVFPSSFAKFGTSYYYLTINGFAGRTPAYFAVPRNQILVFDGDLWHNPQERPSVNALFADGHVQNISPSQFSQFQAEE